MAHLMRQNPPVAGPRTSQDPGSSVSYLFLHPPSSACKVPPARTREVSAAAGSAQQEAGLVTRGRKRTGSKHGEDVPPPPPQAPRVEINPNKRYICDLCVRGFARSDGMRDHKINAHNRGDPWKCHECHKVYSWKKGLEEHLKTKHQGVYLHECPVLNCTYKCQSKRVLDSHLAKKHGEGDKKFPCPMCKKNFDSEFLMDRHVKKNMCTKKRFGSVLNVSGVLRPHSR